MVVIGSDEIVHEAGGEMASSSIGRGGDRWLTVKLSVLT
jgi:hypothetical protein